MSETNRVDAAVREMCYVMGWTPTNNDHQLVGSMLVAADAVMFSDEAVGRVARRLARFDNREYAEFARLYRSRARIIIEAVKGAGNE